MKFGNLCMQGFYASVNSILAAKHFVIEELHLISFIS